MNRGDLIQYGDKSNLIDIDTYVRAQVYSDGKTYVYRSNKDRAVNATSVGGLEWYACAWAKDRNGVCVLSGPYPDWKSALAALAFEKDEYYEDQ